MPGYDITHLKTEQTKRLARQQSLAEVFSQFCTAVFARLQHYTTEAIAGGLRGVEAPKQRSGLHRRAVVDIMMNQVPLIFVVSNEFYQFPPGPQLAGRILMYPADEEAKPFLDLRVEETSTGFRATLLAFGTDGDAHPMRSGEPTEAVAHAMADEIIGFANGLNGHWRPQPELYRFLRPDVLTGGCEFTRS